MLISSFSRLSLLREGVTEVMKAFVDRIPSFGSSLFLIESALGSFKSLWVPSPNEAMPKLSPLTMAAILTCRCVNFALLVSVATFS